MEKPCVRHLLTTRSKERAAYTTGGNLFNQQIMLKKLLMAGAIFFIAIAAKADEGQKVASKVQKVTVFLNGAQVTRTAMVNINAGTTDLIFNDISPELDARSLQVHANGDFTILAVKHEVVYLNDPAKVKQL